ncbi:MAG: hypothetical protein D8M58_15700 [Calditrichaeota bacterium]|nr:MAG: hypothetical protein DWQ03_07430 [Calditrichota bacterium]MBL1206849.1 hypothetical protein [Calditrichota bacterium]NOG46676.1 hypothetical protein [Calditrichota bacterium]
MTTLTLDKIETQTTSSNLERGKIYFRAGHVNDFKITNNRFVEAIVTGNKSYKVFLEIKDNEYEAFCSCPYKSKGYCKHQVAVKLALMKVPEQAAQLTIPDKQIKMFKLKNQALYLFSQVKNKFF